MLGGADPPRKPPSRNPLIRSKSCNAPIPPRRKRGREVLEDITWIVNHHHHSPSSWAGDVNDGGVGQGLDTGRRELIEDGVHPAGPSNTRVLLDPSTANSVRRDMEERQRQGQQEDDINRNNSNNNQLNINRIRSDTSLVSEYNNSTTRPAPPLLHGSTAATLLLSAPTPSSFSRITTSALDSSSPPSSPHQSHYNSRYGQYGNNAGGGGSSSTAGLGLGRRATLPVIPTAGIGLLSSSSAMAANVNTGIARPLSPSLRAPPPLRRSSSNSSLTSLNNNMEQQQQRSPSTLSSPLMSPWMASTPVVPTTGLGSRQMTRAYTAPSLFATPSRSRTTEPPHPQAQARQMPVPVIQREMPSPERKRTRRRGRVLDEEEDEEDDDDDDGDTEDES